MKRLPALIWLITSITSAVLIGESLIAWSHARWRTHTERTALAEVSAQIDELHRLKASHPDWLSDTPSPLALASLVSDTLSACDIPSSRVASITPNPDTVVARAGPLLGKRQAAVVTLVPMSLPQLGRFLDLWQQRSPLWTLAALDLFPQPPPNEPTSASALRVVLTLESMSVQDAGDTP